MGPKCWGVKLKWVPFFFENWKNEPYRQKLKIEIGWVSYKSSWYGRKIMESICNVLVDYSWNIFHSKKLQITVAWDCKWIAECSEKFSIIFSSQFINMIILLILLPAQKEKIGIRGNYVLIKANPPCTMHLENNIKFKEIRRHPSDILSWQLSFLLNLFLSTFHHFWINISPYFLCFKTVYIKYIFNIKIFRSWDYNLTTGITKTSLFHLIKATTHAYQFFPRDEEKFHT